MSKCKTCDKRRTSRRLRPAPLSAKARAALEHAVEDDKPYTDKERAEDEAARARPLEDVSTLQAANRSAQVGVERAHLRLVPSRRVEGLPAHLEQAVNAVLRELHVRSFLPIQNASTFAEAVVQASRGFQTFCELWPAALVAIGPWLGDQTSEDFGFARRDDPLSTPLARRRLGLEACARVAAIGEARVQIARVALRWPKRLPLPPEAADPASSLNARLMAADYVLAFASDLVLAGRARPLAVGFANWFSTMGLQHARDAYASFTKPLYRAPATAHAIA